MAPTSPSITSEPPRVTRLVSADGQSYALSGWTEFLRWARDRDSFVLDIDTAARRLGYSSEEREKVLLHAIVIARHKNTDGDVHLQAPEFE